MKNTDFMGLGVSADLANLLGVTPNAVTCTGTTQGGAAKITTHLSNLTAASNQTGAVLPTAQPGRFYIVNCTSATSAVVYPPGTATINAASSLTVAQNQTAIIFCYSTSLYFSILTA